MTPIRLSTTWNVDLLWSPTHHTLSQESYPLSELFPSLHIKKQNNIRFLSLTFSSIKDKLNNNKTLVSISDLFLNKSIYDYDSG